MEKPIYIEFFKCNKSIKNKLLDIGLGEHISVVLERRLKNIETIKKDELYQFLSKDIDGFPIDEMGDIQKLVDIFKELDIKKSHILIVSDFDCDGITSALMSNFALKDIFKFSNITTIVNKRIDGTGYNKKLVDKIIEIDKNKKIDLLISFDHGSSDEEAYKILKQNMSSKIVITDHHLPDLNNLPNSVDVFINPHIKGTTNEELDICGCATGFITLLYTYMFLHNIDFKNAITIFKSVLPFVCISTISDIMPLSNKYNRYFIKVGLNEINSFRNSLWVDVKNALDIKTKISLRDISHKIAPLINTGNRLSVEEEVFTTFKELDLENRKRLFLNLLDYNNQRKTTVQKLVATTKDYIKLNKLDTDSDSGLVLILNTELSVNGVVAANIGESYRTPVVCFNQGSENISGSIRGVLENINIMDILRKIEQDDSTILNKYGGHSGAGGCSINISKLDIFTKLFKKYVSEYRKKNESKGRTIVIDFSIRSSLVNYELYDELSLLEPYGKGWEYPIIHSTFKITGYRTNEYGIIITFKTLDKRLIKGFYKNNNLTPDIENKLCYGSIVDVYFKLNLNNYVAYQVDLDIVYIGGYDGRNT